MYFAVLCKAKPPIFSFILEAEIFKEEGKKMSPTADVNYRNLYY